MGFISAFVMGGLLGFAIVFAFVWTENRRARSREQMAFFIAGLSRMTMDDVKRVVSNGFSPPWVVFTRRHKVNWLNQELDRVWPCVNEAASQLLQSILEPILEQYRPATIASLKFQKFTLGTVAPEVVGIEMVEVDKGEIMELDIQWDGNPSIVLAVQTLVGVSLPIQVKDIGFSGTFRIIFKPLVDELPCFGAITFSLSEPPKMDFTLKIIGGNMSSVPGLSGIIDEAIRAAVYDSLVWPVRKIIPIIPGDYSDLELRVVGVLEVKVVQARNLLNKDLIGRSDPFAYLFIRPIPNRIKRTRTISNNLHPIWNEHFELEVEEVHSQKLNIKVCDGEGVQKEELLGWAQLELKTLEPGKIADVWLPLVKDLNKMNLGKSEKHRGEVQVELLYRPNEGNMDADTSLRKPTSIALTSLEKVLTSDMNEARQTGPIKNLDLIAYKEGYIIRGVLSVTVVRANNLTAADLDKNSDPYVILKMKKTDIEKRTKVIENTLNPEWNQSFDIMVEDAVHDMLIVEVWDHNTFKGTSIGKCVVTLTKVLHEGEYDAEISLEGVKTGMIFLHLKWTQPAASDPQFF